MEVSEFADKTRTSSKMAFQRPQGFGALDSALGALRQRGAKRRRFH